MRHTSREYVACAPFNLNVLRTHVRDAVGLNVVDRLIDMVVALT